MATRRTTRAKLTGGIAKRSKQRAVPHQCPHWQHGTPARHPCGAARATSAFTVAPMKRRLRAAPSILLMRLSTANHENVVIFGRGAGHSHPAATAWSTTMRDVITTLEAD